MWWVSIRTTEGDLPGELCEDFKRTECCLSFLSNLPRNGSVAEIGVFKGSLSGKILKVSKPQELYLIDVSKQNPHIFCCFFFFKKKETLLRTLYPTRNDLVDFICLFFFFLKKKTALEAFSRWRVTFLKSWLQCQPGCPRHAIWGFEPAHYKLASIPSCDESNKDVVFSVCVWPLARP